MTSERIQPSNEGGQVPESRSPDAIQREIEETRAELAETIDAIADRISPKRAASRSAAAVKAQVSGVFGSCGGDGAPASVLDASAPAASDVDAERRREEVRRIAAAGGGAAPTGTSQFTVQRTLRVDRVLIVVGVVSAIAGFLVLRRSRR